MTYNTKDYKEKLTHLLNLLKESKIVFSQLSEALVDKESSWIKQKKTWLVIWVDIKSFTEFQTWVDILTKESVENETENNSFFWT